MRLEVVVSSASVSFSPNGIIDLALNQSVGGLSPPRLTNFDLAKSL